MTRKQLKNIQNIAAREMGREKAKIIFSHRDEFKALPGAFLHRLTATIFPNQR